MTEKANTFTRIFNKAIKGGFKIENYDNALKKVNGQWEIWDTMWLENILFDHSFCKAFFGEGIIEDNIRRPKDFYVGAFWWQYHIQQLALAEDRLKYLSKFI